MPPLGNRDEGAARATMKLLACFWTTATKRSVLDKKRNVT
jgi:hypothetical protein